jgi:hypothetical protein
MATASITFSLPWHVAAELEGIAKAVGLSRSKYLRGVVIAALAASDPLAPVASTVCASCGLNLGSGCQRSRNQGPPVVA